MDVQSPLSLSQDETKYFYELTPDSILTAFEEGTGLRATGRLQALNSMENRVYEIEVEEGFLPKEKSYIAKFYRPGRWSKEQLIDEHTFLLDIQTEEIPVAAPIILSNNETLSIVGDSQIFFAVFQKIRGRALQELYTEDLGHIGRLIARIHNIGATRDAPYRIQLNELSYGRKSIDFLSTIIPTQFTGMLQDIGESICNFSAPLFPKYPGIRIHGDAHLGNLLKIQDSYVWVDFDDMLMGPAIQDLWLVLGDMGDLGRSQLSELLNGYQNMRDFDFKSTELIEPLRALRMLHFSAWIGRRWHDPAFKRAFPFFGELKYWQNLIQDLQQQVYLFHDSPWQNL